MENVIRTGIALPPELMESFDRRIEERGYRNRSEAIRDLIRDYLIEERSGDPEKEGVASLTLVYDHHSGSFMQKMASIQHEHPGLIRSTLHTHLDRHNCMEVIVLEGKVGSMRELADGLLALKGVKHGKLVVTGKDML